MEWQPSASAGQGSMHLLGLVPARTDRHMRGPAVDALQEVQREGRGRRNVRTVLCPEFRLALPLACFRLAGRILRNTAATVFISRLSGQSNRQRAPGARALCQGAVVTLAGSHLFLNIPVSLFGAEAVGRGGDVELKIQTPLQYDAVALPQPALLLQKCVDVSLRHPRILQVTHVEEAVVLESRVYLPPRVWVALLLRQLCEYRSEQLWH